MSFPPSDRMAINIGYFGLSLNTTNLSGDPFLNCFLSAVTEVPAYIVSTFLLKSCPRRPVLSAFLIIGGGFLLLVQLIPESKFTNATRLKDFSKILLVIQVLKVILKLNRGPCSTFCLQHLQKGIVLNTRVILCIYSFSRGFI